MDGHTRTYECSISLHDAGFGGFLMSFCQQKVSWQFSVSRAEPVALRIQACFQNLSAGVLIAAIGNELFPLLRCGSPNSTSAPPEWASYVGLCGGMLVGLVFMFGIDGFLDSLEGDEDEDDEDGGSEGTPLTETVEYQLLFLHFYNASVPGT